MPEKLQQNAVPDYPPNNRVSASREAVRTINTASGDDYRRSVTVARHLSCAATISTAFRFFSENERKSVQHFLFTTHTTMHMHTLIHM